MNEYPSYSISYLIVRRMEGLDGVAGGVARASCKENGPDVGCDV